MANSITWRAKFDGSDATSAFKALADAGSAAMDGLSAGAARANKAVDGLNDPSTRSAAAVARLQRSADNFRASLDPLFGAQLRYDRELERANGLQAKGALTSEQYASAVVAIRARLDEATGALNRSSAAQTGHAAAAGLNRVQVQELAHSGRAMIDMLAAGQSPIRALTMEAPRLAQVLGEGNGGIAGGFQLLKLLADPAVLAVAAVTGAMVLGAAAALSYDTAQRKLAASIAYGGQASGTTVAQLEDIANAAALAGKASEGQAHSAEEALITTGRVTSDNIGEAVGVLRDFSAASGEKVPDALKTLAKALADPAKGASELNDRLRFLSEAQIRHIELLATEGDRTGAQKVLLDALSSAVDGAADRTNWLALAWRRVGDSASFAFDWLGKAIARAASGPNDTERMASLKDEDSRLQAGANGPLASTPAGVMAQRRLQQNQAEEAQIQARQTAADQKAAADTKAARDREESVAARGVIDKANPWEAQIRTLNQEKQRLENDLADLRSGKRQLPGVTEKALQRGIKGIGIQIDRAQRRESAPDRRHAREEETAANKAAEAEKVTRDAENKAAKESLAATMKTATAKADQARAVLSASAEDASLDAGTRAARIKAAAEDLTRINASDQRLKIELQEIAEAQTAAKEQADGNRKLSLAQRDRIKAAVDAAAAKKVEAANAEDAARRTKAESGAKSFGDSQIREALQTVAGSDGFGPGQRAAAQAKLAELDRAEAQAKLEAILAENGVTDATKARARAALDIVERLKPETDVQAQITDWQRDLLTSAQGQADTAEQKLAADRALLELTQRQRRAQLEVLLARLPPGDEALAGNARAALSSLDASEQKKLKPPPGPLAEDVKKQGQTSVADIEQNAAAAGARSLTSELVRTAQGAESFGQALTNVTSRVFDQLLTGTIDKFITAPLEQALTGLFPQTAAATAAATSTAAMGTAALAATEALAALAAAAQVAAIAQGGASGALPDIPWDNFVGDFKDIIPPFAKGGRIPGFASGGSPGRRAPNGRLSGPGTGTSDSILALVDGRRPVALSAGETIVTAEATKRWSPVLDAMNRGGAPGYAGGGFIGVPSGSSGGGGGSVTVIDNRSKSDPAPRIQQKQNGDTVISFEKISQRIIKENPEAVRDAMFSAAPKVTRRGG